MKYVTFVGAAAFGVMSAAAQTPQSTQPGQSKAPPQQQEQRQQDKPTPLSNVVTMTECVHQTSDQPTVFAIRRLDHADTSAGRSQPGSREGSQSQSSTEGKPSERAADAGKAGSDKSAAADTHETEGAWYRLTANASQNLKQHVGQRVRVNGQLTPGRDERGHDVVIHRITPEKTVVTAIDLKPAPQLSIASITALSGSCDATTPNKP